jgi:hypothetical protein
MSDVVLGGCLYDGQPFTAEKPPGNLCELGDVPARLAALRQPA